MLKLTTATLTLLALLGAPLTYAKEQALEADENGQIEFNMPSGNIGCIYTPEGGTDTYEPMDGGPELSCDRVAPVYVNVMLGPKGKAIKHTNPGEQPCCSDVQVLGYGHEADFDGFVCYSETSGLSCETEDGAHGFTMAKAKITTY